MRLFAALFKLSVVAVLFFAEPEGPVLAEEPEADPLVREIQAGLDELGYDIRVIDGLIGPNTRQAIEVFQEDHERPVTGEPSESLRHAIERLLFQRSEEAGEMWARAKVYLAALGYEPGDEGFDSEAAGKALSAFIEDHDLTLEADFTSGLHDVISERTRTDPGAQKHLCRNYMHERSYEEAYHWCRRAARGAQDVEARYYVGWMYYYGRGVAQSYERAFRWHHAAARAGESRAQTFVGLMYRQGQGVARDPDLAQHWYRQATE